MTVLDTLNWPVLECPRLAGFEVSPEAATRDLVVHNSGVTNELYLQKAGKKARGALGARLTVDKSISMERS